MADVFCKIVYLAVRRLDCKESKTVADKREWITCVNGKLWKWQFTGSARISSPNIHMDMVCYDSYLGFPTTF